MSSQPVLGASQAVDTPYPDSPWVVLKFGGRSVSTVENWAIVARLIRERLAEGVRPVVVHSALVGVSNALIALLDAAVAGGDTDDKLGKIRWQHDALARDLGVDAKMFDERFEALAQVDRRHQVDRRGESARARPRAGQWRARGHRARGGLSAQAGARRRLGSIFAITSKALRCATRLSAHGSSRRAAIFRRTRHSSSASPPSPASCCRKVSLRATHKAKPCCSGAAARILRALT